MKQQLPMLPLASHANALKLPVSLMQQQSFLVHRFWRPHREEIASSAVIQEGDTLDRSIDDLLLDYETTNQEDHTNLITSHPWSNLGCFQCCR
jgi:hypothetical protein